MKRKFLWYTLFFLAELSIGALIVVVPKLVASDKPAISEYKTRFERYLAKAQNASTLAETKQAVNLLYQNGNHDPLKIVPQDAANKLAYFIYAFKNEHTFGITDFKTNSGNQFVLLSIQQKPQPVESEYARAPRVSDSRSGQELLKKQPQLLSWAEFTSPHNEFTSSFPVAIKDLIAKNTASVVWGVSTSFYFQKTLIDPVVNKEINLYQGIAYGDFHAPSLTNPKQVVDATNLNANSFKAIVGQRQGPNLPHYIEIRLSKPMPKQVVVHMTYSGGKHHNLNDRELVNYNQFRDRDLLNVEFVIKEKFASTYAFPNGFQSRISFTAGSRKELVTSNELLKKEMFQIVPSDKAKTSAKVVFASGISTRDFLVPLYSVQRNGADPDENLVYNTNAPRDLKNGDIVYIKQRINTVGGVYRRFPAGFSNEPLRLEVGNSLKTRTIIPTATLPVLNSALFTYDNNRLSLAPTTTQSLPPEVELVYAKVAKTSTNAPLASGYKAMLPSDFTSDHKLYVKYQLKAGFRDSHTFAPGYLNTPAVLTARDFFATEIDTVKLNANAFEAVWFNYQGPLRIISEGIKIRLKVVLPSQVKAVLHFKREVGDINEELESSHSYPQRPQHFAFRDNDLLTIRFAIKDDFRNSHVFPTGFVPEIRFTAGSRREVIALDKLLKPNMFEIVPSNQQETFATVQLKKNIELAPYIKPLYAVQRGKRLGNKWSATAPTNLLNNDVVRIKMSDDALRSGVYKAFPLGANRPFQLQAVSGLQSRNVLPLAETPFPPIASEWFTYRTGQLSANPAQSLPPQVELVYARKKLGTKRIPKNRDYRKAIPQTIAPGDRIYVKYGIKDQFKASHQLAKNYANTPFELVPLKQTLVTTNLNQNAFEAFIIDDQLANTRTRSTSEKFNKPFGLRLKTGFPIQVGVEVGYPRGKNKRGKDKDVNSLELYVSDRFGAKQSFNDNDQVSIRFFIKDKFKDTYVFPDGFEKNVIFTAGSRKEVITVDTSQLTKSSFEVIPASGSSGPKLGLKAGITLPSNVRPFYTARRNVNRIIHQGFALPSNLQKGDLVSIHFRANFEQSGEPSYKVFPPTFANEPFSFTI